MLTNYTNRTIAETTPDFYTLPPRKVLPISEAAVLAVGGRNRKSPKPTPGIAPSSLGYTTECVTNITILAKKESMGIEPIFFACKANVLPLDEDPLLKCLRLESNQRR